MGLVLTNTQQVVLHFHDLDSKGRDVGPSDLSGGTFWSATPDGVAKLTPGADGMSCTVAPAAPGSTVGDVAVQATATTKEGVALAPTFPVSFTANPAASASITADTPADLPDTVAA